MPEPSPELTPYDLQVAVLAIETAIDTLNAVEHPTHSAEWLEGYQGALDLLFGMLEQGREQLRAMADPDHVRTCRICGCTERDCSACIAKTGAPCWWVSEELCSACADFARQAEGVEHLTATEERDLLHTHRVAALCDCQGSGEYETESGERFDCPHHARDPLAADGAN